MPVSTPFWMPSEQLTSQDAIADVTTIWNFSQEMVSAGGQPPVRERVGSLFQ
jgi:hypothetical protein